MRSLTRGTVSLVRVLVELTVVVIAIAWAFWVPASIPVQVALAVLGVVGVLAVWGRFVAPRSPRRLRDPGRLAVEVTVFLATGAAVVVMAGPVAGFGVAAIAIADALVLRWVGEPPLPPH